MTKKITASQMNKELSKLSEHNDKACFLPLTVFQTDSLLRREKALKVIELLAMYSSENSLSTDYKKLHEDLCSVVYRLSHAALDECENKHEDWKKELEDLYKEFKDNGDIE